MPAAPRLTSCAASDHPNTAVAVGEIVGHLQNSLAGSPQFALVLVAETIAPQLSMIARAVHRLLGPDLLLASTGSQIAGADHLTVSRGSIVVWAVCGIDVGAVGDSGEAEATRPTGLDIREEAGGAVAVTLRSSASMPPPIFISGDGLWRADHARILFPPGSATVVRGDGRHRVGPTMMVTEARGRLLIRVDHVPTRAVLVDQLETTDAFVDGPSIEFPPLRAEVSAPAEGANHRRTVDIVTVDPDEGFVELAAPIAVGERVQLIADDPSVAIRTIAEHIERTQAQHDRGVLVDSDLSAVDGTLLDQIATATIRGSWTSGAGAGDRQPWAQVNAVVVSVFDED